jgi:cyclopropane-fatty-acyl-phospholipid synthase
MLTDTIENSHTPEPAHSRSSWLDQLARRLIWQALRKLQHGSIELRDQQGCEHFGSRECESNHRVRIVITDPRFYRSVLLGGTLGAGETYIKGWWQVDDLTRLIRILIQNESAFADLNGAFTRISAMLKRGWHALRRNTRQGSRQNIAAHYDLSNDFYKLFLDETMTYSCGIFERPDSTLTEASIEKLDRICRKLDLQPSDQLLEIGTGWGSFALHAAKHYGCRVTTTTISAQQFELAQQRIHAAGLEDRITLLSRDYRDLEGQFDKLVSIEMIEAIGWQYYPTFFRKCASLLKPDGAAVIQAITMADRYYEHAKRDVDYIKRYIFPGSCIPSIGAMTGAMARHADLTLAGLEDITSHYATTLEQWRMRFREQLPAVRELGFTEAFVRMWEFYLCYCEAGFRERSIGTVQMMLVKPGFRGSVTPAKRQLECLS